MTAVTDQEFFTDKVSHGYLRTYRKLAKDIGPSGHVCELGVLQGGSLAMWQLLFPDGLIAGVDIDPGSIWPEGAEKIVSSQDDPLLKCQLEHLSPDGWDLIIDDCSHKGELTRRSWEMLWPQVRPGGLYVIEDWFVGLRTWMWVEYHDPEMLVLAQSFLSNFGYPKNRLKLASVEYKYGMIILRKDGF